MVSIEIRSKEQPLCLQQAQNIAQYLKNNASHASVLGPAPALINRMNDYYRYRILIKYKKSEELINACQVIHQHYNKTKKGKVKVMIDFNPYSSV